MNTLERSDPRFSPAELQFLTVRSANLAGRGDISFWLPDNLDQLRELPLVILLHGVYGSHWAWALSGGAHITAKRMIRTGEILPVGLVMPSDGLWGDGSGYLRHNGHDYEKWIASDVPEAMRKVLPPHLAINSPMFIAGLSMGGFGALRIGAKYGSGLFKGISGHSSITDFEQMSLFVSESVEEYGTALEDRSVLKTMLEFREALPPVRFDCGTADPLIRCNRDLHRSLDEHKIPHIYEEFEGGHEWPYWERHLEDTLRFFDQIRR